MSEHLCRKHDTLMKPSTIKGREGEFFCSKRVGVDPNTDKPIFCDQTWKPGAEPEYVPLEVLERHDLPLRPLASPPPTNGGMSQSDKERVTRLACLKVAAAMGCTVAEDCIEAARTMCAWAMDGDEAAPLPGPADSPMRKGESRWNQCTDLINKAREEIPYYEDSPYHVVGALNKLEKEGTISWVGTPVVDVFKALNAYAHKRANEKAAGEE